MPTILKSNRSAAGCLEAVVGPQLSGDCKQYIGQSHQNDHAAPRYNSTARDSNILKSISSQYGMCSHANARAVSQSGGGRTARIAKDAPEISKGSAPYNSVQRFSRQTCFSGAILEFPGSKSI